MPRADRRLIVFIMLCVLAVIVVYNTFYPDALSEEEGAVAAGDSLRDYAQTVEQRRRTGRWARHEDGSGSRQPETFPFDPNQADSVTFVRLGLQPWQARNALKYRRKGGRWRSPDDFARLYGLSEETFRRLRPYIRISSDVAEAHYNGRSVQVNDSNRRRYPTKFVQGIKVDLNGADTNTLRRIPGIGRYYSLAIRRYGERLGGYVSVRQVKEIEGLPEDIESWFTLDSSVHIRKLRINQATFKQLVRHPYLNYEQVKSIFEYRQKYGRIKGWEQLLFFPTFTEEDKKRLFPYVSFE